MNIQVNSTSSNLASAMLNSKIRPRAVVGYGVKTFHPSPPNYVTRSPGMYWLSRTPCNTFKTESLLKIVEWLSVITVRHTSPFFFFLQIIRQSGCENLIDSHACLQSSQGCKLNTVTWVVELTYLHIVVDVKVRRVATVKRFNSTTTTPYSFIVREGVFPRERYL